ncbi:hypothetical protein Scep_029857 [Stephania cephalantha]|uniref:Uncharacterized protein n=1 Tax=Stephania cephalantha TaxID=152367 RepID=A0AAP0HGD1_9MAGN
MLCGRCRIRAIDLDEKVLVELGLSLLSGNEYEFKAVILEKRKLAAQTSQEKREKNAKKRKMVKVTKDSDATFPDPASMPISQGLEEAYAPKWGVKLNDSCLKESRIVEDLIVKGSTPCDCEKAVVMPVEETWSNDFQVLAMVLYLNT